MKKKLLALNLLLTIFYSSFSQNMGIGTASPDSSAALDIVNATKGLLIPRMTTTGMFAIQKPAHGLIVYDSLLNQLMVNVGTTQTPNWQAALNSFTGWAIKGNNGTNPNSHFVGTTDNQPLRFRINNLQGGELNPTTKSVFFGIRAGMTNLGHSNVAIGVDALNLNAFPSNLIAIGDSALFHNGQFSTNPADGTMNIAIGSKSLFSNTSGNTNTATGDSTLFANISGSGNTAMGFSALNANTSGDSNVAVGQRALILNTSGNFNTGIGASALNANTSGNLNTGIGSQSLFTNTSGFQNTAIGANALRSNTTGSDGTAIGMNALFSNTTGFVNTAVGFNTLFSNTTGSFNTALGEFSMNANTTGVDNTATGNFSLQSNTTGSNNTATGVKALFSNLTGFQNTSSGGFSMTNNVSGQNNAAYGYSSLLSNLTGAQNTASGAFSLQNNTSGDNNTAIGYSSMGSNTGGVNNTATGMNSLLNNTTGFQNTAFGSGALPNNTTKNNNVAIGFNTLLFMSKGSQNTAIGSGAGNVPDADSSNTFIGFDANNVTGQGFFNSTALGAGSRITGNNQVRFGNASTTSIGGTVSYTTLSDGRFKKNIHENVKGIDFIMKLRPVTYQLDFGRLNQQFNAKGRTNAAFAGSSPANMQKIFTGFVAQEVEQAAKDANYDFSGVDKPGNDQDTYGLRYSDFVAPMVKAIQEQQTMISQLKKISDDLRNQNAELLRRIQKLESSDNTKNNSTGK